MFQPLNLSEMWMKYKFKKLKKLLIKKPFCKDWYRIEKHLRWFTTFEKYKTQRKIDFICKRLWLYQVWKPMFLMSIPDLDVNLVWLYRLKKHWTEWRIIRIWERKEDKIKREENREYRDRVRVTTEKINYIYTIFREKW